MIMMKRTLHLYSQVDIKNFSQSFSEFKEKNRYELSFVLGTRALSRVSELTWEEAIEATRELRSLGKVYLQWDVLMTQSNFKGLSAMLANNWDQFNESFDGIRVQDAGALFWLKERGLDGEVHYICENGNHNLAGLLSWYEFWPEKISRLVLSAEFPSDKLNDLKEQLPCELEVLGAGNILLFYTPRHLVAPLYEDDSLEPNPEEYRVYGTSEESPHKGFPIIDNGHGTFMFNTKELYIFTEEERLSELKNFSFRLDFPINSLSSEQWELLLKGEHIEFQATREMGQSKGFFRSNKTDVLFKKLKNHRLQDRSVDYLGDVVDVKKKEHIAILIKATDTELKVGDEIRLLSPEGREKSVTLHNLWDADRENRDSVQTGQIVFIPHVGGISVRTMVFRH